MPHVRSIPVLDISTREPYIGGLAEAYDQLASDFLDVFPELVNDTTRRSIDNAVSIALMQPDLGALRQMFAVEPILCVTSDRRSPCS